MNVARSMRTTARKPNIGATRALRNVLIKRDLYRATTPDEDQQFEIEHILATGEAKWSQAITSIVKQGVVLFSGIPDLAEYLAFQHVRTLQRRDDMRAVMDHFAAGFEVMELRAGQRRQ